MDRAPINKAGGRTCDALAGGTRLSHCSDDRVTIWHGMSTPAYACGFHATNDKLSVFRGHRARIEGE